jgi:hypothetical protein
MATPMTPIVNAGILYVNGLGISKSTSKIVIMATGAARDSGNVNDITLNSSASINGATVGANGVDVAVLVASSLYAVYVIGDSSGYHATAGIFSLAATGPSLPFGYDMYRRVGYILTDSSANILQFWQYGAGGVREMYYDVGISVLSAGSSTTYANVDLTAAVPIASLNVLFDVAYTPNSATNLAQFLPYGSSATNGIVRWGAGVAAAQVTSLVIPCGVNAGKPEIQYKVAASDSLTLLVTGYFDQLS